MSVKVVRGLVYSIVDGREMRLDLHIPDEKNRVDGVVAYFHGGGFEFGDRADREIERASALASLGVAVATVEYRFTDVKPFPAQLDDSRTAVQWLREHADEFDVNADRVGAWGASAGGHLAALLGVGSRAMERSPAVDAVVCWFAGFELSGLSGGTPLEREIFGEAGMTGALLGGPFDSTNPLHREADPMSQISSDAVPFLLMTGDRDKMMDPAQSQRFHSALVSVGAQSTLTVVGGAGHEDVAFESPVTIGAVASFFTFYLGGQPKD